MHRTLPALLLVLAACPGSGRDDSASEAGFSCEATPSVLAIDEVSALGFSGAEVLALAQGTHESVLENADGTSSPLTVSVIYDKGEVRFMDSEPVDDGSGIEFAIGCTDWVEVDVSVSFSTADGAFAETWLLPVTAMDSSTASFSEDGTPDSFSGSIDFSAMLGEPGSYDDASVFVEGAFDAVGPSGEIDLQTTGHEGEGDDGVSWANIDIFATWGSTSE
jgi:hypothetical protein